MDAICKGSIQFGNGCRRCEKCKQEMQQMLDAHQSDNENEWSEHYWTEGLDRILNASNITHCMLVEHPAIVRAGMKEDIEKLVELMDSLYQKLADSIPEDEW